MIYEKIKSNLNRAIYEYLDHGDPDRVMPALEVPERQQHENDFKVIVDTVLREVFISGLDSNQLQYEEWNRLLNLSIILAKNDFCSVSTPIILLGELLDSRTLKECEIYFSLIDDNINIWKEEFFFKNVKNHLLRTCNDLLRRLSRNQNTVFCGRILIFLANFFPLFERSGLNLTSEFNQDNSTNYSLENNGDLSGENVCPDTKREQKEEDKTDLKVDVNFYKKFWQLQEYFRNPLICYQKNNFKIFQENCNEVLSVFAGYKIDPNSCLYFQALGLDNGDDKTIFFVKYLTNRKLLELQLSDSNFRRHILIQILIAFQYFTSNVKFRMENATLNEEQLAWIEQTRNKANQLIEETPPNGVEVRKVIEHVLNREEFWNNWKNEGCPELKEIVEPEEVVNKTADYIRSTYVSLKRARLGEHVKNAIKNNKILIGNAEMNALWNFCPDNLEACRSPKRIFTPTIEQFFEPILKLPKEKRQLYCSEPNFCWKALRLLSQSSNLFFVPNSQAVKQVSEYLEGVIESLAKEYNISSTPKSANNSQNEDNRTETEDISDDELLKNVDTNSVRSNEDDTMDGTDATMGGETTNSSTTVIGDQSSAFSVAGAENPITDQMIEEVAMKIKDYWDELSPRFGFTEDELDYIKDTMVDPIERSKHLIKIWKDEVGPKAATLGHLQRLIHSAKSDINIF